MESGLSTDSHPQRPGVSIRRAQPFAQLLPLLLLHLLLLSPSLLPAFSQINPHDEAKYIQSGAALLQGEVRDLAWGPLVAVVYAPLHAIFGGLPNGFVLEAWAGRIVLYAGLLLATFYLGVQLAGRSAGTILAGVLFVSSPFLAVVVNQSDAVFVIFSASALARLIAFHHWAHTKDLWIGSALAALAALARVEAVVLIVAFVAISAWLGRRRLALKSVLPAAILPAAGIMALYLALFRLTSGGLDLGLAGKAYGTFEDNQAIFVGGDVSQAIQETRRLFGTSEENQGSVVRAILRNPPAFFARVVSNLGSMPEKYLLVFGKTLGPLLGIFAVWGLWRLIRQRDWVVVAILALWALQPAISLGFLALHFVPQLSYLPLVLTSAGIAFLLSEESPRRERMALLIVTAALGLYGLIDHKPAFLASGLLATAALGLGWAVQARSESQTSGALPAAALLLAAGLILRGPFDFPNYPPIGDSVEEQAVRHMQISFPRGSRILVPYPLPALAANMTDVDFGDVPAGLACPRDLHDWLQQQGVVAIYLDTRQSARPDIYELVAGGEDRYFRQVFRSDDSAVSVYSTLEAGNSSPSPPDCS